MELLLIRHLPTEWNISGFLQGSQDIPLLPVIDEDLAKLEENKKVISSFQPEIVVASQLKRTQQTALHYGFPNPFVEPLLNELNFGKYEGIEKKHLLQVKEWISDPKSLILGERLSDFEKRIFRFLSKYDHFTRILVFGHGSWIRALLSLNQIGSIKEMNQIEVHNNELIYLTINQQLLQLG
ncbi:histidine phosphatase family protein [Schinkia azotoformans]|uniref:Phosphoglycerate mutase n=1 Tax=Schinkia azotoformans LMG 9581 TaxID=1131731 RepID=K6E553_SCHAZ|nr:histidine phosphatase family protein [Schinkia azotoformans]EKN68391.1 phosphoglycerate mutase [Schinkia azotoformans LMG 9581]MEC1638496.1 histidine phosphatase family protein [Schinkia azotoformans]MEC1721353.1 histidine phosphatase family protein [Schinkia azotoformans]MEC1946070.1 histidine phosphatase family protein [Schinkia azotoformans]MED4351572.1 histidine phosphatase family protein [Schinkia azotoformans]